jgi:hypothetical protein
LARSGCALTVTETGPAALAGALARLRDDAMLRVSLSACAQSFARAFDTPALRAQLHTALVALTL